MQDGYFKPELLRVLIDLRDRLELHLITVDPFRKQDILDDRLNIQSERIDPDHPDLSESQQKKQFVERLGGDQVVAIGQGADDAGMLQAAVLGICILSPEGLSLETLQSSNLLAPDVESALGMLTQPMRLVNSLRR